MGVGLGVGVEGGLSVKERPASPKKWAGQGFLYFTFPPAATLWDIWEALALASLPVTWWYSSGEACHYTLPLLALQTGPICPSLGLSWFLSASL